MIRYDDFAELEITIGTIMEVAVVEGTDKLLKLIVDCGEDKPRQIISGIRLYVADPQTLVGQECTFLTNLEHRTIRGYESEGMLLAAHALGDENRPDTFALLIPSVDVSVGTRVR